MKTIKINELAIIALFTVVMMFTACRKNETVIPSAPEPALNANTNDRKVPTVPSILEVPDGNKICFHTYAYGVQIYVVTLTSTGYAWVFSAPEANLYSNEGLTGQVGTHYAGPTWESNSGSAVVGTRLQGVASPVAGAIPWLLLGAVSSHGPGVFKDVTYIQRVNTSGGVAPTTGADASTLGQIARVPYTAEYYFYCAD